MSKRDCGCNEYNSVSRRSFVRWGGAAAVAALSPGWVPRVAWAQSAATDRDIIVSVFLRGGADGLTMVPPYFDDGYYSLRPGLAIQPPDASGANKAIDLDGQFGFAPGMESLAGAYAAGDLLVVHATGLEEPTRSHFEAMHNMEVGQGAPPASLFTGWLGRHLESTAASEADAALRAIGIGYGLQKTLSGAPQALPIYDLGEFGLAGPTNTAADRQAVIEAMYAAYDDPLKTAAVNTTQTIDMLDAIDFAGYQPSGGASYPTEEFGQTLQSTAALIKAEVGVEAVAVDLGGWDTHDNQGPVDGWMATLMGVLSGGLAAFHADLFDDGFTNVAVIVMSEFGRNARENGSAGSDHGHASVMMALGGNIAGGQVLANWPGLGSSDLYDGQDLAITIDYRDVISVILTKRGGASSAAAIFPDSSYKPTEYGVVA